MSSWQTEDLKAFAASDDLHVSPFREDGTTYGTPTWIWSVVVVGDALYVRAYNGTASRWYSAAMQQGGGRIRIAGADHEVTFTAADSSVNDDVDAAYRRKYGSSPYLGPMVSPRAQAATVIITPSE
jgi:hypothetical protein